MAGGNGDIRKDDELMTGAIIQALQGELHACFAKAQAQLDETTLQVVREAVAQATQQVELDLSDQVHQARRCIQELTEKRDSFEVQMARTAAVNKQLLSRVLFLEEKVSALMHQTGPERQQLPSTATPPSRGPPQMYECSPIVFACAPCSSSGTRAAHKQHTPQTLCTATVATDQAPENNPCCDYCCPKLGYLYAFVTDP